MMTEREEVMGLLLGDTVHRGETDGGRTDICIWASMTLARADKRPDRVEIEPEQLVEGLQLAEKIGCEIGQRTRTVGWYHSHPHITCLPSHVDLRTQHQYQAMEGHFVGLIFTVFNAGAEPGTMRQEVMAFKAVESTRQGSTELVYEALEVTVVPVHALLSQEAEKQSRVMPEFGGTLGQNAIIAAKELLYTEMHDRHLQDMKRLEDPPDTPGANALARSAASSQYHRQLVGFMADVTVPLRRHFDDASRYAELLAKMHQRRGEEAKKWGRRESKQLPAIPEVVKPSKPLVDRELDARRAQLQREQLEREALPKAQNDVRQREVLQKALNEAARERSRSRGREQAEPRRTVSLMESPPLTDLDADAQQRFDGVEAGGFLRDGPITQRPYLGERSREFRDVDALEDGVAETQLEDDAEMECVDASSSSTAGTARLKQEQETRRTSKGGGFTQSTISSIFGTRPTPGQTIQGLRSPVLKPPEPTEHTRDMSGLGELRWVENEYYEARPSTRKARKEAGGQYPAHPDANERGIVKKRRFHVKEVGSEDLAEQMAQEYLVDSFEKILTTHGFRNIGDDKRDILQRVTRKV